MNAPIAEIPATTPYVIIDTRSGREVYRTTYAQRTRARRMADKKDLAYGAVRFVTKCVFA